MDRLGELCRPAATARPICGRFRTTRESVGRLPHRWSEIKAEAAKGGRQEMGRMAVELETALAASASPQQVELLQDGFDRLNRLWAAAKSGLF